MRVLFVVPYYTPAYSYGGIVSATETQAEGLVKIGCEVTVVTTDALNNISRNPVMKEIINGVSIFRFPNISNIAAKHLNFYTANGLSSWLKLNFKRFQIIHISDIFSFLMILPTVKLAVLNKIPYVIQPHGLLILEYLNYNKYLLPLKKLILNRNQIVFDSASALVSISIQETQELKKKFPGKTIVEIPNGIKPDEKFLKNKKLSDGSGKVVLVSLGRLHPLKGFNRAIQTMSYLRELNTNFEYLIYGPSEKQYHKTLQNLIDKLSANDFIKLMGPIYNNEKYSMLSNADLFIMPSISEAQGIVMIETLNCGTPAIVSKEAYLPEYKNYNCCIESDFNDYKHSAEIINNVISNKDELLQKRSMTVKLINEQFSSDIFINKLADLYLKILEN